MLEQSDCFRLIVYLKEVVHPTLIIVQLFDLLSVIHYWWHLLMYAVILEFQRPPNGCLLCPI